MTVTALLTESIQMKVKFLKEVLAFKIVVCKAKMPFTQTHLEFSLFMIKPKRSNFNLKFDANIFCVLMCDQGCQLG